MGRADSPPGHAAESRWQRQVARWRVPTGESDLGLRFYTWKPTDLKLQEERFKFQRGDQVESSLA